MSEDTTDAEWAASLTGCVRNEHFIDNLPAEYRNHFCEAHDMDGNPAWDQCRWGRVAEALAQARAEGLRDAADRLDGEAHRLPVLGAFAAKFRARANQIEADS